LPFGKILFLVVLLAHVGTFADGRSFRIRDRDCHSTPALKLDSHKTSWRYDEYVKTHLELAIGVFEFGEI
jgi:hypothetical protein